jgi:hypothetical protein
MKISSRLSTLSFWATRRLWRASLLAGGFFSSLVMFLASLATPALAATPIISDTAGAHTQICNIFTWMFWILISVSIIMVMWAAYLFVTAQDDAEQITEAKKAIFYAALGIVAGLLARGFPLMVASIFPNGTQGVQGC